MFLKTAALSVILLISQIQGATIRVPSDQPTIQAGIDAASESDTVLVAPGVYSGPGNLELNFRGVDLTLLSEQGPRVTTISGAGDEPMPGATIAIFNSGETPAATIQGFTFKAAWCGIYCGNNSSPTVRDCSFEDNYKFASQGVSGKGAAMACLNSSPLVERCTFINNVAAEYLWIDPDPDCWDLVGPECFVELPGLGGAAYLQDSYAVFRNCTFVDNWSDQGTAIYSSGGDLTIQNCILAFHGIDFNEPFGGRVVVATNLTITCSLVYGNRGGDWTGDLAGLELVDGNLSVDPLFCDPSSAYALSLGSPCLPENNSCGLLIGGSSSICGTVWHVATTGDDINGNGSSAAPFRTIQRGIDVAFSSDTVLVAPGTYTGEGNRDLDFHGVNLVLLSETGPDQTIIDCENAARGLYFHSGESPEAIVEGFTITRGFHGAGAGIACENGASPRILNCHITECNAYDVGDPTSTDVGNAPGHGAALYCNQSAPSLTDCVLEANATQDGWDLWTGDIPGLGGAIFASGSTLNLVSCEIKSNHSTEGGGLWAVNSTVQLSGCHFESNQTDYGSTLYLNVSNVSIVASHFLDNHSPSGSTSAIWSANSQLEIAQSQLEHNQQGLRMRSGTLHLDDVDFQYNVGYSPGGAMSCRKAEIEVHNCSFVANEVYAEAGGGAIYLDSCTAGFTNCRLVSNTAAGCLACDDGAPAGNGGAISSLSSTLTMTDCELAQNSVSAGWDSRGEGNSFAGSGGAIWMEFSEAELNSCLFLDNGMGSAPGTDGATLCAVSSQTLLKNCTLVDNNFGSAISSPVIGAEQSTITLDHTIVAFQQAGPSLSCTSADIVSAVNCNISGNEGGDWVNCLTEFAGINGNISTDPAFCDFENGDYHLDILSPCAPGVQPNVSLIGAFGVGCGAVVCGDADGDGELTQADLQRMIDFYYMVSETWPYPVSAADMDCDGVITIADVVLLAGYISGYGPPPCCAPPPPPRSKTEMALD